MTPLTLSTIQPLVRSLVIGSILMVTVGVVTWPLILHLNYDLPVGTEQEVTVPLFNTWTLWWVQDRASQGFENFWQAPIFFPSEGSFTFSEPQPLTGLLASFFWNLADSPLAAYNFALLTCLFLNGVFAYRLGRALQIPSIPALVGGILMIGLPITQKLLGVLPLIPIFGILWALEGFIRFGRDGGSMPMAMWAGTGLLVQLFTSQQLTLLFGLFALPAGLLALSQRGFAPIAALKLGSVGLVVMLLTVWYAWYPIQVHQTMGLTRPDSLVKNLSAHLSDYFSKPLSSSISFPPREDIHTDTGGLFPGFMMIILATWGTAVGLQRRESRAWTWYFLGTAGCAWLLSLGIHSPLDEGKLFIFLRDWIPGFHELRSPFRFAILVQMSLIVLGLHGLAFMNHRPWTSKILFAVSLVGLIAFAENLSVPQPLSSGPTFTSRPWVSWMTAQENRHILGHIPFPDGLHVSDYEIETERMLNQIIHRKSLINGYSGYFPPGYDRFQMDMAKNFPSQFLICFLSNELGTDTLIIDLPWYENHQEKIASFKELSKIVYHDKDVVIFELSRTGATCRPEAGQTDGL
ncbi:MAG: hypothetical protein AB7T38_06405 [Nitrospirales bacterium]